MSSKFKLDDSESLTDEKPSIDSLDAVDEPPSILDDPIHPPAFDPEEPPAPSLPPPPASPLLPVPNTTAASGSTFGSWSSWSSNLNRLKGVATGAVQNLQQSLKEATRLDDDDDGIIRQPNESSITVDNAVGNIPSVSSIPLSPSPSSSSHHEDPARSQSLPSAAEKLRETIAYAGPLKDALMEKGRSAVQDIKSKLLQHRQQQVQREQFNAAHNNLEAVTSSSAPLSIFEGHTVMIGMDPEAEPSKTQTSCDSVSASVAPSSVGNDNAADATDATASSTSVPPPLPAQSLPNQPMPSRANSAAASSLGRFFDQLSKAVADVQKSETMKNAAAIRVKLAERAEKGFETVGRSAMELLNEVTSNLSHPPVSSSSSSPALPPHHMVPPPSYTASDGANGNNTTSMLSDNNKNSDNNRVLPESMDRFGPFFELYGGDSICDDLAALGSECVGLCTEARRKVVGLPEEEEFEEAARLLTQFFVDAPEAITLALEKLDLGSDLDLKLLSLPLVAESEGDRNEESNESDVKKHVDSVMAYLSQCNGFHPPSLYSPVSYFCDDSHSKAEAFLSQLATLIPPVCESPQESQKRGETAEALAGDAEDATIEGGEERSRESNADSSNGNNHRDGNDEEENGKKKKNKEKKRKGSKNAQTLSQMSQEDVEAKEIIDQEVIQLLRSFQAHCAKRMAEICAAQIQLLVGMGTSAAAPARPSKMVTENMEWPEGSLNQGTLVRKIYEKMLADIITVAHLYLRTIFAFRTYCLEPRRLLEEDEEEEDEEEEEKEEEEEEKEEERDKKEEGEKEPSKEGEAGEEGKVAEKETSDKEKEPEKDSTTTTTSEACLKEENKEEDKEEENKEKGSKEENENDDGVEKTKAEEGEKGDQAVHASNELPNNAGDATDVVPSKDSQAAMIGTDSPPCPSPPPPPPPPSVTRPGGRLGMGLNYLNSMVEQLSQKASSQIDASSSFFAKAKLEGRAKFGGNNGGNDSNGSNSGNGSNDSSNTSSSKTLNALFSAFGKKNKNDGNDISNKSNTSSNKNNSNHLLHLNANNKQSKCLSPVEAECETLREVVLEGLGLATEKLWVGYRTLIYPLMMRALMEDILSPSRRKSKLVQDEVKPEEDLLTIKEESMTLTDAAPTEEDKDETSLTARFVVDEDE
mmetsp:Transcript_25423/g.46208  ORF Transcript_25423/g.46208 Transcript_25423/m.46208 type:complete len:1151 (-) Transcript_25423:412-3864(-)